MNKILKYIIIFVGMALGACPMSYAQDVQFTKQKQVRKLLRLDKTGEAQTIINDLYKTKSKDKKAATAPQEALTDSTEYYFLTGLLKQHMFEKENTKLYLKQNPDTVAYFSRLYEMMDAFEHCYPSITSLKKESDEAMGLLQQYKNNLIRGGNFYLAKKNMKSAFSFFNKFIVLGNKELIVEVDSVFDRANYNCAYATFQLQEYDTTLRYANALIRRGYTIEEVDLLICDALSKLGRMDEWKEALQQAISRHPDQFYFYAALIDYYLESNSNDKALKYADELQKSDPMSGVKNFVKGYVYQHIGDYRNAIIWQEICDRLQPGVVENLSALGFNYVAVAEEYAASLRGNYTTPEAKKELTGYYTKAKEYLEACRKKVPDQPQYWAPALYKVYYHLNDGDALDEIEEILHNEG